MFESGTSELICVALISVAATRTDGQVQARSQFVCLENSVVKPLIKCVHLLRAVGREQVIDGYIG
jgi:hypothetical protein